MIEQALQAIAVFVIVVVSFLLLIMAIMIVAIIGGALLGLAEYLTQPSPSLAQTPRPVASAGELTGREGPVAGEREQAEARAGSLRSRCEDSGREANGDSSSS